MSIESFIPELWEAKMLVAFREQAIFAGLTNREYEGSFSSGDTIHINSPVPIVIKDYKANNRTTEPDPISTTEIEMVIDQEKNFDFYIDDIDRKQAAGNLSEFATSAAEGLVDDADLHLATLAVTGSEDLTPVGGAVTNAETAWNCIRDMRKYLRKNKVPAAQRVFVANAEFAALLEEYDSKIMRVDTSGTTEGLRQGTIGGILGFTGYNSENLPETDKPQIVAFHRSAIAFASQLDKTEAMRGQNKFADRLRGLHVYGSKIVRPSAIVSYTAA